MKTIISRFVAAILALSVLLTGNAHAQKSAKAIEVQKRQTITLRKGDTVVIRRDKKDLWKEVYIASELFSVGGWVFDMSSSHGKYEKNPLFQDDQGKFSDGKYIAVNGSLSAVKAFIAWKFPRARPFFSAFNFGWSPRFYIKGAQNLGKH